jgi:hypothetical protein
MPKSSGNSGGAKWRLAQCAKYKLGRETMASLSPSKDNSRIESPTTSMKIYASVWTGLMVYFAVHGAFLG